MRLYSAAELGNTSITRIAQDADGYIWIGTDFGLLRFDGYTFSLYQHKNGDAESLPSSLITSLDTYDGRVMVGTSGGISVYDGRRNAFNSFDFKLSSKPRVGSTAEWNGQIIIG